MLDIFVQWLDQAWSEIVLAVNDFSIITDTLDIALLAYFIYKGIKIIRETRAGQLVKGIFWMAGLYLVVRILKMSAMIWILNRVFEMGIIAVIVVFQPELRSALERMGRTKMKGITPWGHSSGQSERYSTLWGKTIDVICEATRKLSMSATGALIVIEREVKLGEQIRTGVVIDATPSSELIGNIFFKNSPLHDGAMIMRDGKVYAASCFLPKPKNEEDIDKNLGSRHRAAIGISEVSDSVTIIVSEETGSISFAVNGRLIRNLSIEKLHKTLDFYLIPETKEEQKEKNKAFWKVKKNEKERKSEDTED